MDATTFAVEMMFQYRFTAAAQRIVLDGSVFEIDDPNAVWGGGQVIFGYGDDKTVVHFNTAQHEAAVHELAHAWWFLIERQISSHKDAMVGQLLANFLINADLPPGDYRTVRKLCRVYKYGDGHWPGMWMDDLQRWNHDEIFAGLASGTMGDLRLFPSDLRELYGQMFRELETVFIPQVVKTC